MSEFSIRCSGVMVLSILLWTTNGLRYARGHPPYRGTYRTQWKAVTPLFTSRRIVGDPACGVNEQATQAVNVEATKSLVEVCKLHDIQRLVFASTCSVYGASELMELNEGSFLNPLSLYAESKIDSEEIILHETHDMFSDNEISPTILRLGTIFGWSRRMRFDLVVNILTAKAVLEGDIPVYGGEQYRPLVHVHDAARAFADVLEAPDEKVEHQIFNVGDNDLNYQIKKVGRLVEENVEDAEVRFVEHKEDERTYRVSFDKINHILGWEAKYDIVDGVEEIKTWMDEEDITDYGKDDFPELRIFVYVITRNQLALVVVLYSHLDTEQSSLAHRCRRTTSPQPLLPHLFAYPA